MTGEYTYKPTDFPLILHWAHRTRRVERLFFVSCIRCRWNVFAEPLPSSYRRDRHRHTDWWESGFMKYPIEMDSSAKASFYFFQNKGSRLKMKVIKQVVAIAWEDTRPTSNCYNGSQIHATETDAMHNTWIITGRSNEYLRGSESCAPIIVLHFSIP
jgi:hypothetical protein